MVVGCRWWAVGGAGAWRCFYCPHLVFPTAGYEHTFKSGDAKTGNLHEWGFKVDSATVGWCCVPHPGFRVVHSIRLCEPSLSWHLWCSCVTFGFAPALPWQLLRQRLTASAPILQPGIYFCTLQQCAKQTCPTTSAPMMKRK